VSPAIGKVFNSLWSDINSAETFPDSKPLLSHYTSIEVLENILTTNEIWFSNPLFMNDLEELRFGLNEGAAAFNAHSGIRDACGTEDRYTILREGFNRSFREFEMVHAFDTYVLCLSEHDPDDSDGLLSMWRGYGNNGNGVAIVMDTQHVNVVDVPVLILSKVSYKSPNERFSWIKAKLDEFALLLKQPGLPADGLPAAAFALLERIKTFALFTKHHGFREEKEWRFAHLKQYDHANHLKGMLGYAIGKRGLEPKLKYKLAPIDGITAPDLSLEKLVHQIILGPSASHQLAARTLERMFVQLGRGALVERMCLSSTPFRAV